MSSTAALRGRRAARLLAGLVVAGTLIGPARAGNAETTPAATLGGFEGTAAASGLHALYNAGGVLPIASPVDLGAPDALSTIASGPQTFARASVLDPGDLLANPDAFLALASSSYPAGTLPAYPFRVSASSSTGAPTAESNPGPGLNARVSVDGGGSTAQSTMPALDAPALATVGSMSAKTTTRTDGATVTVTARTQVSGINLLGLVTIDSVVTDLAATSDGNATKLTGGTKVSGASVLGQPVTIDTDGIHQAPGSAPLLQGVIGSLTGSLNDILAHVGIHITLAGPVQVAGGAAGQRGSDGLRVDLELSSTTLPQLATLLGSLPPIANPLPGTPSIEDLLAVAKARHLASIELGRGLVSLAARPAVSFASPLPSPSTSDSSSSSFVSGSPGLDLPPTAVPSTPVGPQTPLRTSDAVGVPTSADIGLGVAALVLLALLASPFIGELLARLCNAVLAADPSESCSWEER